MWLFYCSTDFNFREQKKVTESSIFFFQKVFGISLSSNLFFFFAGFGINAIRDIIFFLGNHGFRPFGRLIQGVYLKAGRVRSSVASSNII